MVIGHCDRVSVYHSSVPFFVALFRLELSIIFSHPHPRIMWTGESSDGLWPGLSRSRIYKNRDSRPSDPIIHYPLPAFTQAQMPHSRTPFGSSSRPMCAAYKDLCQPLPPGLLVDQDLKDSETRRIASNSTLNNMGYVSKTTLVDRSLHVDKKHLAFMTQSLGTIAPRVLERPLLFNEADVV